LSIQSSPRTSRTGRPITSSPGQLEAAFAGVDHAFLLVTDEKGGIRSRIIIVE
jgi:hypothetical protein